MRSIVSIITMNDHLLTITMTISALQLAIGTVTVTMDLTSHNPDKHHQEQNTENIHLNNLYMEVTAD